MEDYCMKEFVAFSKKLLRVLVRIRQMLENGDIDQAKTVLDELIEDTKSDIEA